MNPYHTALRMSRSPDAYGIGSWLETATTAVTSLAQSAQQIALIGQSPTKMSWSTIHGLQATNPELAAQYAQIKSAYEAQQALRDPAPAVMAPMTLTAPAPAPAERPAWLIPAVIAAGIGAALLMLKK